MVNGVREAGREGGREVVCVKNGKTRIKEEQKVKNTEVTKGESGKGQTTKDEEERGRRK